MKKGCQCFQLEPLFGLSTLAALHLVPVFAFGENDIFDQVDNPGRGGVHADCVCVVYRCVL